MIKETSSYAQLDKTFKFSGEGISGLSDDITVRYNVRKELFPPNETHELPQRLTSKGVEFHYFFENSKKLHGYKKTRWSCGNQRSERPVSNSYDQQGKLNREVFEKASSELPKYVTRILNKIDPSQIE